MAICWNRDKQAVNLYRERVLSSNTPHQPAWFYFGDLVQLINCFKTREPPIPGLDLSPSCVGRYGKGGSLKLELVRFSVVAEVAQYSTMILIISFSINFHSLTFSLNPPKKHKPSDLKSTLPSPKHKTWVDSQCKRRQFYMGNSNDFENSLQRTFLHFHQLSETRSETYTSHNGTRDLGKFLLQGKENLSRRFCPLQTLETKAETIHEVQSPFNFQEFSETKSHAWVIFKVSQTISCQRRYSTRISLISNKNPFPTTVTTLDFISSGY